MRHYTLIVLNAPDHDRYHCYQRQEEYETGKHWSEPFLTPPRVG